MNANHAESISRLYAGEDLSADQTRELDRVLSSMDPGDIPDDQVKTVRDYIDKELLYNGDMISQPERLSLQRLHQALICRE